MVALSHIFVAIAISFSANVFAEAPTAYDLSTSAPGYKIQGHVEKTHTGLQFPLTLNAKTKRGIDTFGKTSSDLLIDVDYETDERLHVKISDKAKKQFQVPNSPLGFERPVVKSAAKHTSYDFQYTAKPFSFKVIRKSDHAAVFDSSNLPLVFEDQYLEISTKVPKDANIYGFGEVTAPFRRTTNITTLFARDNADDYYRNIYGAQPYYNEIRNGKAHGALLMNQYGMDIVTTEGRITYKVIGGVLDFYFFIPKDGNPNSVAKLYTDLIGKPMMPSQWMLGWHHCRYGYEDIDHVETVVKGYKDSNIPLESAWIDIDYMDNMKDFTVDNVKFPQDRMIKFGKDLHDRGQKYIVMVDPAINANTTYEPYVRGTDMDVFLKSPDGSQFIGSVWPGFTVWPDWTHPNATEYWEKEIIDWVNLIGLDGLWIDMNEPASFCLGSCGSGKLDAGVQPFHWTLSEEDQEKKHADEQAALEALGNPKGDTRNLLYPKYAINNGNGNLSEYTAAMTAVHHGNVAHYDLHNLYGHAENVITRKALEKQNPGKRPFLLTRSNFVGSGKHSGHWTGDNTSTWRYLKISISNILSMQMFGITYSGADVCGFNGVATEEMCTRWMELGAFYPFARNHNVIGSAGQEPYVWNSTAEASRIALGARYEMLPYFYTLFEESNRVGTGVWRPLIFEYPDYQSFTDNDVQFLIGSDILISPVVDEGATSVDAQFPAGTWYDWYSHEITTGSSNKHKKETVKLDAPLTHIPIHIRGGSIIPTKTAKYTVDETYATDYNIIIALDKFSQAEGRLYIDDGESLQVKKSSSIDFTFKHNKLSASGKFDYKDAENLSKITILGEHATKLTSAKIGNKSYKLEKSGKNTVTVSGFSTKLSGSFSIQFS